MTLTKASGMNSKRSFMYFFQRDFKSWVESLKEMSGIEHSANKDPVGQVRVMLEALKMAHGWREPDRGDLDDPRIEWRMGKPDYTKANYEYLKGKTQDHDQGSLEEMVENLVKAWETEASHFKNFNQWKTVEHSSYNVSVNGCFKIPGKTAFEIGNYNALMMGCPSYKKYGILNFEESHDLFRNAFRKGFPWEVLKVLSQPPHILLTWRHWGEFTGAYKDNHGQGEKIEMYGILRITVNDRMKIEHLEVFYDPETFIEVMEGKKRSDELKNGTALLGDVRSTAIQKTSIKHGESWQKESKSN